MNPNAGEPVNPGGAAVAVGEQPVNNPPTNPLADLEGVVAAAQEAAQATPPVQASAETPQGQFVDQFGSGPATPPVAEVPTNVPVAPLDSGTIEAVPPPEDPQATFVQEVRNAVKKLEEATKKEVSV